MFKNKISLSSVSYKKIFKTDDTRFILSVGLKVSGISFAINLFVYWFIYQIMRLNYAFFKANGFPELGEETPFFDLVIQETIDNVSILFLFHIILFFIGVYVGWLILRPFVKLGEYCEKVLDNPDTVYSVDQFSTYSLLTRFSEFFFEYLREARKRRGPVFASIPPQFSRIHKPVFDKIFMLHFGILLVIISISSAVFIIENSSTIFGSMIELATKTLSNQKGVSSFFTEQNYIIDQIVGLTIVLITFSYILLGFHLYAKVSGAAFGIFSTMRSFMKGNYSSRVHLVGFAYIRDNTRKLNKYLDYIEKNIFKDSATK